ncbi:hypothetical protein L6452_38670 [Arctium lappa]|uniref:Uncharacterized protein n=1 Tax=Arctium lappa TaxID=4217 RepID=A0ACB8XRC2_ARCLA|nr:hypothetical protein L6452_38670 [Arctium lappa]
MGATRAHKFHTSLRGGYEYGGPTIVDYHNYKRDCDNFMGRGDAKVLVELMSKKQEANPIFVRIELYRLREAFIKTYDKRRVKRGLNHVGGDCP